MPGHDHLHSPFRTSVSVQAKVAVAPSSAPKFLFINSGISNDATTPEKRRIVRSKAARHQSDQIDAQASAAPIDISLKAKKKRRRTKPATWQLEVVQPANDAITITETDVTGRDSSSRRHSSGSGSDGLTKMRPRGAGLVSPFEWNPTWDLPFVPLVVNNCNSDPFPFENVLC